MTVEEALYCLKSYMPDAKDDMCKNCKYYGSTIDGTAYICGSNTARKIAIRALEREIPKKPIKYGPINLALSYRCPICNNCFHDYFPRCIICGQKLDWSELTITESV